MAKRKRLEENRRDRISELPSHIRQHILSFLSTRDALRSSILSTTWRYDWLSLPCLDFGKAFFRQYWKCADIWKTVIETTSNDPAKASEFFSFLNQALIRPRPTVQKLVLYLPASGSLSYEQLTGLFKKLGHSKYLCLHADTLKNVIIPGELRQSNKSPLCQFENLRLLLRETLTTEDITACIDGLLWLCPEVKTICITDLALFPTLKSQSEIYIKLEYKVPKELGPKGCGCYDGLQIHCWRHSLNGFEIIKHYGVEDDGSLKRFFKNAMVGRWYIFP